MAFVLRVRSYLALGAMLLASVDSLSFAQTGISPGARSRVFIGVFSGTDVIPGYVKTEDLIRWTVERRIFVPAERLGQENLNRSVQRQLGSSVPKGAFGAYSEATISVSREFGIKADTDQVFLVPFAGNTPVLPKGLVSPYSDKLDIPEDGLPAVSYFTSRPEASFVTKHGELSAAQFQSFTALANNAAKKNATVVFPVGRPSQATKRRLDVLPMWREDLISFVKTFPKAKVWVAALPINATFPYQAIPDIKRLAKSGDINVIQAKHLETVLQRPVLVIVDDSWPSDEQFVRAKKFVQDGLERIWSEYKRGPVGRGWDKPPPLRAEAALATTTSPPNGYACTTLTACRTHASRIAEALKIAQGRLAVADNDPVEVIYLPMTLSQKYSEDILGVILRYYFMETGGAGQPLSKTPETEWQLNWLVRVVFSRIPKSLSSGSRDIGIEVSLYDAILFFLQRYTLAVGEPAFLSISWSTDQWITNSGDPSRGFTFPVAALGNNCPEKCGADFMQQLPPTQFATRVGVQHDYTGVMSLNPNGTPACSSTRPPKTDHSIMVFGFDGNVSDGCGTSFATPKVAWLLAAREAMAPKPSEMGKFGNSVSWFYAMQKKMRGLRRQGCSNVDDYDCFRLDPTQLFSR